MREAVVKEDESSEGSTNDGSESYISLLNGHQANLGPIKVEVQRRRYGFSMTAYGTVNSTIGGVFMLVLTIILSTTLQNESAQSRYTEPLSHDTRFWLKHHLVVCLLQLSLAS